ncbi:putative F-box domain-containing protein [Dioscorea sansibarensis]
MSALIRERILHCLPAKQLLNLRRVSRHWNDFITSPFFIHSHSQSSMSISGVFYIHPSSPIDQPSFNPFGNDLHGVQSPGLNFLPEPVAVLSSSRGLLCCQTFSADDDGTTKYFIANPLTGSWVLLPPPANDHGPRPAAVIVFDEPFTFNFSLDYKLVVAYDLGGCYGFEVFSSREWEWSVSKELCVTERIEPESGVAAGGCAHWRTSMQTVVSYDPEVDRSWDVVWPESYREDVVWELVEIGGRLSCVCVRDDEVCVYGMGDGSQGSGWMEVRKVMMRRSGEVRVVRVQEVREVVLVENGRVWGWSLEDGKWREGDWYVGEGCERFVSFVGSLLHAFGSWG